MRLSPCPPQHGVKKPKEMKPLEQTAGTWRGRNSGAVGDDKKVSERTGVTHQGLGVKKLEKIKTTSGENSNNQLAKKNMIKNSLRRTDGPVSREGSGSIDTDSSRTSGLQGGEGSVDKNLRKAKVGSMIKHFSTRDNFETRFYPSSASEASEDSYAGKEMSPRLKPLVAKDKSWLKPKATAGTGTAPVVAPCAPIWKQRVKTQEILEKDSRNSKDNSGSSVEKSRDSMDKRWQHLRSMNGEKHTSQSQKVKQPVTIRGTTNKINESKEPLPFPKQNMTLQENARDRRIERLGRINTAATETTHAPLLKQRAENTETVRNKFSKQPGDKPAAQRQNPPSAEKSRDIVNLRLQYLRSAHIEKEAMHTQEAKRGDVKGPINNTFSKNTPRQNQSTLPKSRDLVDSRFQNPGLKSEKDTPRLDVKQHVATRETTRNKSSDGPQTPSDSPKEDLVSPRASLRRESVYSRWHQLKSMNSQKDLMKSPKETEVTRNSPTQGLSTDSQRRRSISPRRRGLSPRQRSISPRRRGVSPRQRSISPRRRGVSPRRNANAIGRPPLSPPKPRDLNDSQVRPSRPLNNEKDVVHSQKVMGQVTMRETTGKNVTKSFRQNLDSQIPKPPFTEKSNNNSRLHNLRSTSSEKDTTPPQTVRQQVALRETTRDKVSSHRKETSDSQKQPQVPSEKSGFTNHRQLQNVGSLKNDQGSGYSRMVNEVGVRGAISNKVSKDSIESKDSTSTLSNAKKSHNAMESKWQHQISKDNAKGPTQLQSVKQQVAKRDWTSNKASTASAETQNSQTPHWSIAKKSHNSIETRWQGQISKGNEQDATQSQFVKDEVGKRDQPITKISKDSTDTQRLQTAQRPNVKKSHNSLGNRWQRQISKGSDKDVTQSQSSKHQVAKREWTSNKVSKESRDSQTSHLPNVNKSQNSLQTRWQHQISKDSDKDATQSQMVKQQVVMREPVSKKISKDSKEIAGFQKEDMIQSDTTSSSNGSQLQTRTSLENENVTAPSQTVKQRVAMRESLRINPSKNNVENQDSTKQEQDPPKKSFHSLTNEKEKQQVPAQEMIANKLSDGQETLHSQNLHFAASQKSDGLESSQLQSLKSTDIEKDTMQSEKAGQEEPKKEPVIHEFSNGTEETADVQKPNLASEDLCNGVIDTENNDDNSQEKEKNVMTESTQEPTITTVSIDSQQSLDPTTENVSGPEEARDSTDAPLQTVPPTDDRNDEANSHEAGPQVTTQDVVTKNVYNEPQEIPASEGKNQNATEEDAQTISKTIDTLPPEVKQTEAKQETIISKLSEKDQGTPESHEPVNGGKDPRHPQQMKSDEASQEIKQDTSNIKPSEISQHAADSQTQNVVSNVSKKIVESTGQRVSSMDESLTPADVFMEEVVSYYEEVEEDVQGIEEVDKLAADHTEVASPPMSPNLDGRLEESVSLQFETSFQLRSPGEDSKQKVILDFAAMEQPSPVRRQHLKVIADLEELIEKVKKEEKHAENRAQKEMKAMTLQDLLKTSRDWGELYMNHDRPEPNLTMDEVADILTHIHRCETTNAAVRWDLITDIVFPDLAPEEAEVDQYEDLKPHTQQGENPALKSEEEAELSGEKEIQTKEAGVMCIDQHVPRVSHLSSDGHTKETRRFKTRMSHTESSSEEAFENLHDIESDRETAEAFRLEYGLTATEMNDVLEHMKATETFRSQYGLTEEDMANVISHLNLCEETNTPVRWDLIHRIIYPDDQDHLSLPPMDTTNAFAVDVDDCHSAVSFDDAASGASWFSIYIDFDDCASSVTFLVDGDDVKAGKKSKRSRRESMARPAVGTYHPSDKRRSSMVHSKPSSGRSDALLRKRIADLVESNQSVRNLTFECTKPLRRMSAFG